MQATHIPDTATLEQLREIAFDHNWDDGVATPTHIADHPRCDLSLALELFWLANAEEVYLGKAPRRQHNGAWFEFCQIIAARILSGHYAMASSTFSPPLTKVQVYQLRKEGLPEPFLSSVTPTRA